MVARNNIGICTGLSWLPVGFMQILSTLGSLGFRPGFHGSVVGEGAALAGASPHGAGERGIGAGAKDKCLLRAFRGDSRFFFPSAR